MTINEAYKQIEKDRDTLYNDIMEIFKAGESYPAFTIERHYEQLIISIFKYHLMGMYPDKFLVTYVIGTDYDKVCHAFRSWYRNLSNGNIEHYLRVNHLKDADKYVDGSPIKGKEIYHQRYLKALEIKNIPNQDVLYRMMSIVELI